MDGHHKLIKWGFVTHGCIDGFTRFITYLKCSTNNKSKTVLQLFQQAIEVNNVPSRVRGDRGGENVLVADKMIELRGVGRNSYLGGPSKFNTRIERLWKDVMRNVIVLFRDRFVRYEEQGLDMEDPVHMFALHHMFLPLINHYLDQFVLMWNNHKLSTENHCTPIQLRILHAHQTPPPAQVEDIYGLEEDAEAEGDEIAVNVPQYDYHFDEVQLEEINHQCPALHMIIPVNMYDEHYFNCLHVLTEILNR